MTRAALYRRVCGTLSLLWLVIGGLAAYLAATTGSEVARLLGVVLALMSGQAALRNGLEWLELGED